MIIFNDNEYEKFKSSKIVGTGYLAYRDIPSIIELNKISLNRILDLGCGMGRSTSFLKELSVNVYATDVSPYALNFVKKNITKNVFINTLESHYENFPYSVIFSIFTFFHLTNKKEIINEFARCFNSIENKGHLILVVPSEDFFYRDYESLECDKNQNYHDGYCFKIKLRKINCTVNNYYWSYSTLINLAVKVGFGMPPTKTGPSSC